MKISELNDVLGIDSSKLDYTFMVLNTAETAAGLQTTYKVSLKSLGNSIVEDFNVVMIDPSDAGNNIYSGTMSMNESDEYDTGLDMTVVGQYITSTDRNVLDSAVTGVEYDTTNKKIITTTYGTSNTDVVTTASLLNDMDLNITQITNTAGKTLATIDEASGKVSATFQDISILSSQVSDKSDAINSSGSTLATSKAVKDAIESLDITQITNTAGKTVATIDEADGKVSATFQDISITSSQISDKGTAGCVATLDANGHVPSSQLPSYVDDVIEGTVATFPATGETGKIYVDTATNTSYRWSGSQYVKVASDLSLGETSSTAYRGDYGAAAYAHGVTNKGIEVCNSVEDETTHEITKSPKLVKVQTNAEGHVTAATAVSADDIRGLSNIIASDSVAGLVKTNTGFGTAMNNGVVTTVQAYTSNIKPGSDEYRVIVPANQHVSTFYGLAKAASDTTQYLSSNAVGNYTDEAKVAIQKMLGIYEAPWELIREDSFTNETEDDYLINRDSNNDTFELTDAIIIFQTPTQETAASKGDYGRVVFTTSTSKTKAVFVGAWTQEANAQARTANAIVTQHNGLIEIKGLKVADNSNTTSQMTVSSFNSTRNIDNQEYEIVSTPLIFTGIKLTAVTGTMQYWLYGKRKWTT